MTEKLKFIVEVDSATGVARLRGVKGAEDNLTKSMQRQDKAAKGLSKSLKGMVGALGGFLAFRSITSAMKDWVTLAGVQQEAVAGMEQAMRSMGRYTPELRDRLIETAEALQTVTTIGDEATIAGQKFLLTYKNIGDDVLPHASAVMLDLAALMGGDTKMAANMLGKASMGLSGELRRVGITIDENIAKGGDFAAILKEIEKQVGGQAEALARTGIGPWKQLGNIWGDAKEDLGELTLLLTREWMPMLREWVDLVKEIAEYWTFVLTPPDVVRTLESRRGAIIKQLGNLEGLQRKGYGSDLLKHMFGFNAEELAAKIEGLKAELLTVSRSIHTEKDKGKWKGTKIEGGGGGGAEDYSAEYYAGAMEEWQNVTAGFEGMEKDLQDRRTLYFSETLNEWTRISQEFYDAEYERDAQRAAEFIEIRENMRLQDLDALQAAMDAETAIIGQAMRQQEATEAAKAEIARTAWHGAIDDVVYALGEFGKHSKTAFTAFKAAAIAQTIIATYSAAQKSYDALADIPYIGPALGAAAAAAAIAAGMARVAAIQSTTPEGGAGGGAVGTYPASPSTGLPTSRTPAPAPITQGPGQGGPGVYIHIEGDSINDEAYLEQWAEKISKLVENRDVYLMASNSQYAESLS